MEQSRLPNSFKKYRRIAGLTQVKVAAILNLKHTSAICHWEKGDYLPSIKQLFQLCIIYNAQPEQLLGEFIQSLRTELFAHDEPIIN